MKKISIGIIAILLVGIAFAQPPKNKSEEQRQGPDMEKLQILLDLNDEQVVQMEALLQKQQKEMQAKRALMSEERNAMMEEMKVEREQVREAHQNELEKILTPEQLKKFEVLRQERQGPNSRMEGRNSPRGHDHPADGNKNDE